MSIKADGEKSKFFAGPRKKTPLGGKGIYFLKRRMTIMVASDLCSGWFIEMGRWEGKQQESFVLRAVQCFTI